MKTRASRPTSRTRPTKRAAERDWWQRWWSEQRRRDRAELETYQRDWLTHRLRGAETELVALDLPRTCWQGLRFRMDDDEDGGVLQEPAAGIQAGPTVHTLPGGKKVSGEWPGRALYELLADSRRAERGRKALQLACIALAADAALRTDSPAMRFTLGRFFERVQQAKRHPELMAQVVKEQFRRWGHSAHETDDAKALSQLHALIRSKAARLRAQGRSGRCAAKGLWLSKEIQRAARKLRGKPYSFSGIRYVIDQAGQLAPD